jgi:hypothetical protein
MHTLAPHLYLFLAPDVSYLAGLFLEVRQTVITIGTEITVFVVGRQISDICLPTIEKRSR